MFFLYTNKCKSNGLVEVSRPYILLWTWKTHCRYFMFSLTHNSLDLHLRTCFSINDKQRNGLFWVACEHLFCFPTCTSSLCWSTVSAHSDTGGSHRSNISVPHLPTVLYYPSFSSSLCLPLSLSLMNKHPLHSLSAGMKWPHSPWHT